MIKSVGIIFIFIICSSYGKAEDMCEFTTRLIRASYSGFEYLGYDWWDYDTYRSGWVDGPKLMIDGFDEPTFTFGHIYMNSAAEGNPGKYPIGVPVLIIEGYSNNHGISEPMAEAGTILLDQLRNCLDDGWKEKSMNPDNHFRTNADDSSIYYQGYMFYNSSKDLYLKYYVQGLETQAIDGEEYVEIVLVMHENFENHPPFDQQSYMKTNSAEPERFCSTLNNVLEISENNPSELNGPYHEMEGMSVAWYECKKSVYGCQSCSVIDWLFIMDMVYGSDLIEIEGKHLYTELIENIRLCLGSSWIVEDEKVSQIGFEKYETEFYSDNHSTRIAVERYFSSYAWQVGVVIHFPED